MISKHILGSLERFLIESARQQRADLFLLGNEAKLRKHAKAFKYFSATIESYQEYRSELLPKLADSGTSSDTMRVQLILAQLDKISLERATGAAGQNDSDEDEEKEEETQDETAAEDSEEEEGGIISSGGAKRLMASLSKDLSYIDHLKQIYLRLQEQTALGKLTKVSAEVSNRFMSMATRLKDFVRSVSEFLGIKGVFIAIAKLMMMSKAIEVPIKIINTILVVSIFLVFIVVYPLYRFGKNPLRVLKWVLEDVEFEIPEFE